MIFSWVFYSLLFFCDITSSNFILSSVIVISIMADLPTPESTPWGWKALIIACVIGAIFLGFIYLAVNSEADYMPSQQRKHDTQQHAFKEAPTMSADAIQKAQEDKLKREEIAKNSANTHGMTEEEHAHMVAHEEGVAHSH